jgi:hypothetical protein
MVTEAGPVAADLVVVSVSTLVPVVGLVPQVAVTPLGSADVMARLTLPVNPPASVTEMVALQEEPRSREAQPVEAASQKPGFSGPARASISGWPAGLPHPVTRS